MCDLPYMKSPVPLPQSPNPLFKAAMGMVGPGHDDTVESFTQSLTTDGLSPLPYMSTYGTQPQSANLLYRHVSNVNSTGVAKSASGLSTGQSGTDVSSAESIAGIVPLGSDSSNIGSDNGKPNSSISAKPQPKQSERRHDTCQNSDQNTSIRQSTWAEVADGESVVNGAPHPVTIEGLDKEQQIEVIGIGVWTDPALESSVASAPLPAEGLTAASKGWFDVLGTFSESASNVWGWLRKTVGSLRSPAVSSVVRVGGRIALVRVLQTPQGQQIVVSLLTSLVPGLNVVTAVSSLSAVWSMISLGQLGWSIYQTMTVDGSVPPDVAMSQGVDAVVWYLNNWELMAALGAFSEPALKVI